MTGLTDLDTQFEELITEFNAAKARVVELESDKHINKIEADALEDAANKLDEAGHVDAFAMLTMIAWKLRGNNEKDW